MKTMSCDLNRASVKIHSDKPEHYVPRVCLQCGTALCIDACTIKFAMSRDEKTGAVIVDHAKCDGCGKCVITCSFSAIRQVSDAEVSICDLCSGDPACVKYCPTGAILYMEPEEMRKKITNEALIRFEKCIAATM
jgi:carbon-monoxide dehydrogenase iron sulfur subunit